MIFKVRRAANLFLLPVLLFSLLTIQPTTAQAAGFTIHTSIFSRSGITEAEINNYLASTPLPALGHAFLGVERAYGINAKYLLAHAMLESGWGRSDLTKYKRNLFGYGAADSDPFNLAYTFGTFEEGIYFVANKIYNNYLIPSGPFYNGPTLAGMNVFYASDPLWANKIASIYNRIPQAGFAPLSGGAPSPAPAPAPVAPAAPAPEYDFEYTEVLFPQAWVKEESASVSLTVALQGNTNISNGVAAYYWTDAVSGDEVSKGVFSDFKLDAGKNTKISGNLPVPNADGDYNLEIELWSAGQILTGATASAESNYKVSVKSDFAASYSGLSTQITTDAASALSLNLEVHNEGLVAWENLLMRDSTTALTYRWYSMESQGFIGDPVAVYLPELVAPGQSVPVELSLMPPGSGSYLLEIDTHINSVGSLNKQGNQTIRIPVEVADVPSLLKGG